MSGATPPDGESRRPSRSPFYEARHASRYERQQLIRCYRDRHGCRLVVLIDRLFPDSVTLFEETLYDADPEQDLHVLLATPGGDGETAIRLVRQAQSRCRELTVIVPDPAKSVGTLFALGAHHIFMGPTSDLSHTIRNSCCSTARSLLRSDHRRRRRGRATDTGGFSHRRSDQHDVVANPHQRHSRASDMPRAEGMDASTTASRCGSARPGS